MSKIVKIKVETEEDAKNSGLDKINEIVKVKIETDEGIKKVKVEFEYKTNSTKSDVLVYNNNDRIKEEIFPNEEIPLCNTKPFSCNICRKLFKTSTELKMHAIRHTGERMYSCDHCDKSFFTSGDITRHKRTHTGEKPHSCNTCGKSFARRSELKLHNRIHTGEKPYSCGPCGKSFSRLSYLKEHNKIHSEHQISFKCELCIFVAKRKQHLQDHTAFVHEIGSNRNRCQICEKQFMSATGLHQHRSTHTGEKPFQCDICSKCFKQKNGLKEHTKSAHSKREDRTSHICELCAKTYLTYCGLKQHMMSHTGEKPFQCDKCSRLFKLKSGLESHSYIHSESRDFKCDQCLKSFLSPHALETHMKTHDEKCYECNYCHKRFSQLGNFKTHERLHTGEKPYICDTCGKAFVQKGNLNSHKEKCKSKLENGLKEDSNDQDAMLEYNALKEQTTDDAIKNYKIFLKNWKNELVLN